MLRYSWDEEPKAKAAGIAVAAAFITGTVMHPLPDVAVEDDGN